MSDKISIERVKMLRMEYKLQTKGYRERVIKIVCYAFRQARGMQKCNSKKSQFYELIGMKASQRKKSNIVTEMICFVMGANSTSKRKRAWKFSRAVEYLSEIGTRWDTLEKEIKKRGGLEAVAREAAKQQPRRQKRAHASNTRSVFNLDPWKRPTSVQGGEITSNESKEEAKGLPNDQKVPLLIEVQMSDMDELRELKAGRRVKLIATRLGEGRHLLRVKRVRKLS